MLEILYQDENLIAINKPSGLLVHKSLIDKSETRFAVQILRDQINQYVYPLHRLDKPTSGILLFALNKEMAKSMSNIIQERETQKEYIAIVRGITSEKDEINYALKEVLDKMTDSKANQDKEAKEAITEYERLNTIELPFKVGKHETSRYSLVRLNPKTGRKHQLRRHMKHIFHPIVGDTTHGDLRHTKFFKNQFNCNRLLLHASKLSFKHPIFNQVIRINAGFDITFNALFKEFNWEI